MALTEHYSVKEVAARLHVAERTVWRWVHDRRLAHVRIGGCVRIKEADVQKMLASCQVRRVPLPKALRSRLSD